MDKKIKICIIHVYNSRLCISKKIVCEQLMKQILLKIMVGYKCPLTTTSLVLNLNFTVWPFIE